MGTTTYDKLRELAHAYATGQAGAQGVTLTSTAPPLVNIALPDWAAETFVLALMPLAPVNTAAFVNPSPTTLYNPLLQVRLQWGNSKAMQDALVDYPTSGVKLQVSGSQIRAFVEYRNPPVVTPAGPDIVVGAILTPGVRDTSAPPPFWTSISQVVDHTLLGNTVDIPVPPHARAYRLFGVQTPQAPLGGWAFLLVKEYMGAGPATQLTSDSQFPDGLTGDVDFRPLASQASFLRIGPANALPGTVTVISAQFILDIG